MAVYVYILKCRDGSYYVGSANDLERRLHEHQTGFYGGYTSTRRPVELVWSEVFEHAAEAVVVERQIKGWSRAKKEALIRGDWPLVRTLSRRRGGKPKSSS
jgi:putative endonuclease